MTVQQQRAAWQTLDSAQLLLISCASLLIVVAVTQVAAVGLDHPRVAVCFGALIAIGELVRMVMPGNREVAPIGTAGGLGYALLVSVGDERVHHSALQVVTVAAVGMLIGSLPHIAVGRAPRLDAMARRLVTVSLVAFCFRPIADSALHDIWAAMLAVMAALVILSCLLDVIIAAMIRAESVRTRFGIALVDEMRAKMRLCAATGATGMLIAVSTSTMGLAALLVFTAPILVTQFAFRRYAIVHATYLQTVRALSRVAEVGGYVETGHARRVARLSIGMGRELGEAEPELLELEYAALMHDIGQLSLRDPIPGGATVLASPAEQYRIAELGAAVIKQTGVLDRVAEIVRRQCDPYRVGRDAHTAPPLASRIIKVANAYDDLVGDSNDRDRSAAVLERLRLDSTSEYDPAVVEALGRVVDRAAPVEY
ncbi:MAG TPA: HD domain-containing phosphohydrolase [Streptosporangiaceae bacterium]